MDTLFELEERFWTGGADFYRHHLAPAALMVFPDPTGVLLKDEALDALAQAPRWSSVALEEHRVLELTEAAALVTYKAVATRPGEAEPYVARASSAYVRDRGGRWRLAFHQQTPDPRRVRASASAPARRAAP